MNSDLPDVATVVIDDKVSLRSHTYSEEQSVMTRSVLKLNGDVCKSFSSCDQTRGTTRCDALLSMFITF